MKNYIPIIVLLLIGCSNPDQPKIEMVVAPDSAITDQLKVSLNNQQLSSAGVEIGSPQLENIISTISLQGTIDLPPSHQVSLSFPVGGYIRSTKILPGQKVTKGETLAIIEDMQFIQLQQDYLMARTNFELGVKEFERQKNLNATKASSDKVLQEAMAEMERQQILMSSLGEKLKLIGVSVENLTPATITKALPVRSPVNGFVSKVNTSVGKYTSPTDVLFELIDPSDKHLALKVYEKDISRIAIGTKVRAFTNNRPDQQYAARVILINPGFDENRSTDIHCHFERDESALRPGMFVNAEVVVQDVKAMVVPEDAVVRWANKHYIFVVDADGEFIMTEITPGILTGGKQQIDSRNITVNSKVVVKNAFALLMKIKNVEKEG